LKKKVPARRPVRKTTNRTGKKRKRAAAAPDTGRRYELAGLAFFAFGLIAMCGLLGLNVGFVGNFAARCLRYVFGIGAWPMAVGIMLLGFIYASKHHGLHYSTRFFGFIAFFISMLAIYHHFTVPSGAEILPQSLPDGGGLLGGGFLFLIRKFFGVDGGFIVLCIGTIGSILLATTWSLAVGLLKTKEQAENGLGMAKDTITITCAKAAEIENAVQEKVTAKVKDSFYNQDRDQHFKDEVSLAAEAAEDEESLTMPTASSEEAAAEDNQAAAAQDDTAEELPPTFTIEYSNESGNASAGTDEPVEDLSAPAGPKILKKAPTADSIYATPGTDALSQAYARQQREQEQAQAAVPVKPYELPKVQNILSKHVKQKNRKLEQEIAHNAQTLGQTLANFKVKAKIINACHGPAVTRYELEPAPGVKVSKITNLADDIALSLAAFSVRIEQIPGKAAIGIEVPNKELEGVQLREVLENDAFAKAKSKLTVGLGMDIGGQAILADLAKMPHLLVAGATGSGKSVCINTLITSILFKAKPDEVKFILIDPKVVELSNYNGIPHMMVPVVTDAKKAASVLNWAVQEMEKRYAKFASHNVRNMAGYNKEVPDDKMPAVVIIIDELADLMMVAKHDVEDAICRLAQKARAAGIHLVLATQRPSVDVITGLIKANIPSRISFAVSSQIDSRTILDMSGAEKLLGKGDMLFFPIGAAKPHRVQGAFVSDEEVEMLLDFIKSQGQEAETNEEIINFTEQAEQEAADASGKAKPKTDELLSEAVNLVLSTNQASSSSIQRRFRIGYTRAARLIDTMEELGIVGPNPGSNKPREILMTSEQAEAAIAQLVQL
jgi:S-DNA-T family DNA segregation ATPase FtsK/SpoIIIE